MASTRESFFRFGFSEWILHEIIDPVVPNGKGMMTMENAGWLLVSLAALGLFQALLGHFQLAQDVWNSNA